MSQKTTTKKIEIPDPKPAQNNKYKWLSLGVMALALAIIVIDGTVLNVSQKYVIQDLNTDIKSIQWAFTGYSLVLAALTIFGGRLGDMFGRKKMFILGAIIFAIGSGLTALSQDVTTFFFGWAVIEGIGASLMIPASSALIVSNFEGKERGLAFGIYGAVAGAASSFGPILGGFFASNIGWRWAFGINVVIGAILCLGTIIVRDRKDQYPEKTYLDYIGVILSSLGLTSLVYGVIESTDYGWLSAKKAWEIGGQRLDLFGLSISFWSILIGLILLVSFVLYELKLEKSGQDPLFSMKIFTNRQFTLGSTSLAALFGGFSGLITYGIIFYLLTVKNLDALQAGLALIPFSLATLVMAPLSARLSDKFGQKNVIILGLIINTIGAFLIRNTISYSASVNNFIFPFIVSGFGFGLIAAQFNNLILSSVAVQESGVASGVSGTMREVARAFGIAIIGSVFIGTLTAGAVAGIQAQSDKDIPPFIKTTLIDSLNRGENNIGRDTKVSDAQIIDNLKKQNIQLPNQVAKDNYLANYRIWESNIKKQIDISITESSRAALTYTIGFNIIALVLALGLQGRKKAKIKSTN